MPKGKVSTPFQKISLFNFCLPKKDLLFGEYKGTEGRRKHEEAWAPVYVFAKSISVPINPKKDDWMSLKKLMNGWKLAVENKIKDRQSPSTGAAAQTPFDEVERLIEDMFFAGDSVVGKVDILYLFFSCELKLLQS